jgi:hypothetical protein
MSIHLIFLYVSLFLFIACVGVTIVLVVSYDEIFTEAKNEAEHRGIQSTHSDDVEQKE